MIFGTRSGVITRSLHTMGLDSTQDLKRSTWLPAPARAQVPHDVDRPAFFDDLRALELRLAIIDDRHDRLARRSDPAYQAWRRDTVGRVQSLAARAARLQAAGDLPAHHVRRVAAVLATLRNRVAGLDAAHAEYLAESGGTRAAEG
ncbi:hypothetical protein ACGGZK_06965 [Agromyces sp. MMS24-K17]|uniref:hypothetical protein n=1 Tax=Agromyces sp. MMS24-K17 TaxID=3372850 RepID=UPI0037552680